jgi:hypothetical protein
VLRALGCFALLAAPAAAQTQVAGWGLIVFDSQWNGPPILDLDAGGYFTGQLRGDGSLVAFGNNAAGQCHVPTLPAGTSYDLVATGGSHSVARRSDGVVVAWGFNTSGQCNVPSLPVGTSCVGLAAGQAHSVALLSDGSAIAWGDNTYGQCTVPTLPSGSVYVDIAAGGFHTLAIRSNGSVLARGRNDWGQINIPAPGPGLGYVSIAGGSLHSLLRRSDGAIILAGPFSTGAWAPPASPPAGYAFGALAAGTYHSIVILDPLPPVSTNSCTAGTTTNGCVASMSSSGVPSAAAASGFTLDCTNVEGQKQGLLFYGISGAHSAPWGLGSTSYLCVKSPTQRTPTQNSGGTTDACDGALTIDFLAWVASHPTGLGVPFSSGDTVWSQAWFRDPAAPKTTSLSDGLEFTLVP